MGELFQGADESAVTVIRPSVRNWRTRAIAGLAAGSGMMTLIVHNWSRDPVTGGIVIVATVLLVVAVIALYLRNVRVDIGHDEVVLHGLFGRVRAWPRSVVKGCAYRTVVISYVQGGTAHYLVFYGAEHKVLFKLNADLWADGAIGVINQALGYSHRAGNPSARTLRKHEFLVEFPGGLNFWERHPVIIALVATVGMIFGLVLLIDALGNHTS